MAANETSYSEMATGDVDAIGDHCQAPYCRQLDFLPFRCESCKGKFCLDHRTEDGHSCRNAGAHARKRREELQRNTRTTPATTKPSILTHEQQCSSPTCKTLVNTPLITGVHCDKCNRTYCLKHRFPDDHDCAKLTPLGARPGRGTANSAGASSQPTQREKGLAALSKLRAWGANKRANLPQTSSQKSKAATATQTANLAALKKRATGPPNVSPDDRIYLHVEASSETVTAKIPSGDFFYHKNWTAGRVLDAAAKSLQVGNVNNQTQSEGERLRVFWVEGGRLLAFGERVGDVVGEGETIVLIRGVGEGMAGTPDKVA